MTALTIGRRFNGPPESGNGGYVCGSIAEALRADLRVRLTRPPPLETPLQLVAMGDDTWQLEGADGPVALAAPHRLTLDVPEPPRYVDAVWASQHYAGFQDHPFPECFVCGPQRRRGVRDGVARTDAALAIDEADIMGIGGPINADKPVCGQQIRFSSPPAAVVSHRPCTGARGATPHWTDPTDGPAGAQRPRLALTAQRGPKALPARQPDSLNASTFERRGYGSCRRYGRQDRVHTSLENRTERGFPQLPQPFIIRSFQFKMVQGPHPHALPALASLAPAVSGSWPLGLASCPNPRRLAGSRSPSP